ncbi:MAG: T9SS type A sorting domain-containing protein, partial [Rhodothermia bacterium]|nr:T9SS type A sorting domain-containing protein [Rhodothermia bacterium]
GDYDWRPYESKDDSVAVWYRVYLNTPEGLLDGYDNSNPNHHATVTGDSIFAEAPFNWGSSQDGKGIALTRESTNDQAPGYDIFSGVVYYPMSAAGTTQLYKFVLEDETGIVGWEEGDLQGDRSFVVPSQDTTLQWVYFGNQPPSKVDPVTQNVIFAVDLTSLEEIGVFRVARGDTLEVRGTFNNFGCNDPTICLMDRVPGENLFEGFYSLSLVPGNEVAYKYFLNFNNPEFITEFGFEPPEGWEEGHRSGVDRTFIFEGNPNRDQDLGLSFFNDITELNVIPAGTSITVNYSVDMAAAVANSGAPFDPASGDSVWINVADPIWAFTQRVSNPTFPFVDPTAEKPDASGFLTDPDNDGVFTGSVTVEGPTYSNLTYRYKYNSGVDVVEEEGTGLGATPGRNRTVYIKPNPDGTWPSSYDIGAQSFMPTGALPFEDNPAFSVGVEPVDGELPAAITLKQNFPNPFNPTTTFEYAITASQKVQLHVYDVIGRRVATLVNGVQPPNTYRVNFDAADLASGTYFYRLETADKVITRSMVLLK